MAGSSGLGIEMFGGLQGPTETSDHCGLRQEFYQKYQLIVRSTRGAFLLNHQQAHPKPD